MSKKIFVKNIEVASKEYADSSFEAARSYADTKKQEAINTSNTYTDNTLLGYVSKYECTINEYNNMTEQQKSLYDLFIINDNLLPEGYTQLEYLESNGVNQYINTGILANSNIKMEVELLNPDMSDTDDHTLCGGGVSWGEDYLQLQCRAASMCSYGNEWDQVDFVGGEHITITQDKNKFYQDDRLLYTFPQQTFTTEYPIFIFSNGQSGVPAEFSQFKIASFKIYDNGTLVRNYIPCSQDSTGKNGFYDSVSETFYGLLIYNGNEYEDIEYVENTSTDFILPDVVLNNGPYTFELQVEPNNPNTEQENWVLGVWQSEPGLAYGHCRIGAQDGYWTGDSTNGTITYSPSNEAVVGQATTITATYNGPNLSWHSPVCLFSQAEKAGLPYPNRWFSGKIYYCKIYENGNLIRDLVPKHCVSTDTDGLYDNVNNIFYPLLHMDPNDTLLKAVITHGTERVDTGIIPNEDYSIEATFRLADGAEYGIDNYDWYLLGNATANQDAGRYGIGGYDNQNIQNASPRSDEWYDGDDTQPFEVDTIWQFKRDEANACYKFYHDDVLVSTKYDNHEPYQYDYNWNIFTMSYKPEDTVEYARFFCGRLYNLKIYSGNDLICFFIPVRRNGTVCLYDLITQEHYYNGGSGQFDYMGLEEYDNDYDDEEEWDEPEDEPEEELL